jgi:hypothetical protein
MASRLKAKLKSSSPTRQEEAGESERRRDSSATISSEASPRSSIATEHSVASSHNHTGVETAGDLANHEAHLQPGQELSEAEKNASKYRLAVHAGSGYDASTHVPVHVNASSEGGSIPIENSWVKASIRVRIRSYNGLPSSTPAGCPPYFDPPSRSKDGTQYSISFNFVPKVDLPASTAIWGNDFDHPVRDRLPPGFNFAVSLVKSWVDPSIELDAYAEEPWMYAPALCCFFAMRVGEKKDVNEWTDAEIKDPDESPLEEGADGR